MNTQFCNIKICVWFIATIVMFTNCTSSDKSDLTSELPNLSISFDENQSIEEQELGPDDYLLLPASRLREEIKGQIRIDGEGNIYLPDHQSVTIRVFDSNGRHIRNIGSEGNGPGEFIRIGAIEIFNDELTVYDSGNKRLVTFKTNGQAISEHPLESQSLMNPVSIHRFNNGSYLNLERQNGTDNSGRFVHQITLGQTTSPVYSFAQSDSILTIQSTFEDLYSDLENIGRVWLNRDTGDFWLVPGIYKGKIYHYKEMDGQWHLYQELKGFLFTDLPIVPDTEEQNTFQIVTYFPKIETFSGTVKSFSLGIFQMSDGQMIHISSQLFDGQRQTIVELFNGEGELQGSGRLNDFTFSSNTRGPLISPLWKDHNDQIYFIDYREESPVLRIGKLQGL